MLHRDLAVQLPRYAARHFGPFPVLVDETITPGTIMCLDALGKPVAIVDANGRSTRIHRDSASLALHPLELERILKDMGYFDDPR